MARISPFTSTFAFAVAFWAQAAHSADLEQPPVVETVQPEARAFYVRGDFGYAFNRIGEFGQPEVLDNGGQFVAEDFGNSPYIGAGVGWRAARWLRFDLTAEYRFSTDVVSQDYLRRTLSQPDGLMTASTTYSGKHTAIVGLANAYIDLPKFNGITPYVGAGIGFARSTFSDFTTVSSGSFVDFSNGHVTSQTTSGYANEKSTTSFAWALMGGLSLDVSERTKLDLGYRYVHLGSSVAVSSGIINCECGTIASPLTGDDLESHEFRVGLRFELGGGSETYAPLK